MNSTFLKISFIFILFVLLSCQKKTNETTSVDPVVPSYLWVDETEKYLPLTAEWTNRVEVADINGDEKLDLIFANGGDYSEPGIAEASRVFINQGPDQQFKEVTSDIFGNNKFYARVIKVRDLNQDNIPDLFIGATFQTQSELYIGKDNGVFQRVTSKQLPAIAASIGDIEFGDVDNDGDLDIVLADWGPTKRTRIILFP